jgi:hypothetical protein
MSIDRRRLTRQIRLPEVGDAGQARLAAAHVDAAVEGFAADVARNYMHRAGIGAVAPGGARVGADVGALGLRHPAAREVGEGALVALAAVRAILGLEARA